MAAGTYSARDDRSIRTAEIGGVTPNAVGRSRHAVEASRPDERWFVVHSLPHREAGAAAQLVNQGFRAFLPCRLKTRRHARRLETIQAPLFPRYLFVVLDPNRDRWRSINGTFGVAHLVMAGERPQPVPRGIVEALIAMADEHDILNFEWSGELRIGGKARILAGPFAEHVGLLTNLDDSGRVRLLLDIMGGRVPVHVHKEILMPAT